MINETKTIKMRDGVDIHCRIRETGSTHWIIATHGIGEHLGRHQYLVDMFSYSFNIFHYDLRGHGQSGGEKGRVDDFHDFMRDLGEIIQFLKEKYRMQKYILFGHSMGALIVAAYLQQYCQDDFYPQRVFLSAPPVGLPGPLGAFVRFSPMSVIDSLNNLKSGVKLGGLVDLRKLSHDARVYEDYISDPLNSLKLHTKLLVGLAHTSKSVFSRPLRLQCPTSVAVGSEDKIVHVPSVEEYFSFVEKGVSLKVVEGAYHEMHNEIDKYRKHYFAFLKSFLQDARLNVVGPTPEIP